ncbi:MAG: lipocalin [Gammaproteobacteria bacterium SG8_11]|nr:MAG: lipocalin [Gammaproteobacteria bacterium SG8_11]
MKKMRVYIIFIVSVEIIYGCVSIPDNVQPIDGFELNRYLGTWYEIARLDHSFERGLMQVTATYSMRDDGGVKVINRGFNAKKNEWDEAEGKAYFVGESSIGRLKVSFFGPFYGGYNIIELDKQNYQYSLVCGPDKSYLWILARDPNIDKQIVDRLVAKAQDLGFSIDELIFVGHDTPK